MTYSKKFRFIVEIEVKHVEGKFMSSDELSDQIVEALEDADPGSYSGDNGGEYETVEWKVGETNHER